MDFRGKYAFLSNFAEVEGGVKLANDKTKYKTVLNALLAAQVDPKNAAIRAKIQRMSAFDAMQYSRSDKSDMPAPPPGWEMQEQKVLRRLLKQKFKAGAASGMAEKLLATGQAELVDPFGGTVNILGELLMEVRNSLREEMGWQAKANPRRNPDDDDDYADAPVAVAPSQLAVEQAAAAAAAASYRTAEEQRQLREADAARPRVAEQKAQQTDELKKVAIGRLRTAAEEAWKEFTVSLRARNKSKETKEQLKVLLSTYTLARKKLEKALDERDIEILKKPDGADALRKLLTEEAFQFAAGTRAVYAQRPKHSKDYFGTSQRSSIARDISEMVDAFGRPLAPPSRTELQAAGLSGDLVLAPATLPETASEAQKATSKARSLGAGITYTQLRQAADIAAKAERASAKGTSASAVYCQVAGEDKRVALRLANAEPFHQLLFGKLRGAKGINNTNTVTLWISPPGLKSFHVIFYANGFPTCEFHADAFLTVLATVFKYTEDWINDPRHPSRQDYRVLIGQSGLMFPHTTGGLQGALFQIWGPRPDQFSPPEYEDDYGAFVSKTAAERLISWGLLSGTGLSTSTDRVPSGVARFWTSEQKTTDYQAKSSEAIVTAEANAYKNALAAAGYESVVPREIQILEGGTEALLGKLASDHATEIDDAIETGQTFKIATLYYPRLYAVEADQLVSTSENEDTARQLKKQLDTLVATVEDGTTLRVIDGGLFRGAALLVALRQDEQYDPARAFGKDERGVIVVTPPAFYLRQQLIAARKSDIQIEVVCPVSSQIKKSNEYYLFERSQEDDAASVRLSFIPARGLSDSLKADYASGSTLVLWNDPDTETSSSRFGSRHGMEDIAEFLVQSLGMYKRVVVESEYARTVTDLQTEVEKGVAQRIWRGFAKKQPLSEILGLPAKLIESMEKSEDPVRLARAALVAVAGAYGKAYAEFFVLGGRSEKGATVQWARENRGSVRGRKKQLPSLVRRR